MARSSSGRKWLPEIADQIKKLRQEIVEGHDVCGGRGYIPAGTNAVHRCDCMVVFRYLKALAASRIPADYWRLKLEELHIDSTVLGFMQTYVQHLQSAADQGLGATLFGTNGIGKTSVLCEVGKTAIVQGWSVRYFTLSEYIAALFDRDEERVAYFENGQFLLIDELDKKQSDKIAQVADEMFRRLFHRGKSLILATNWDEEDLEKNLGQSTASLLKRRCEFLVMEGADYSEEVQSSYLDRLTQRLNHWNRNVIDKANELEEASWQN